MKWLFATVCVVVAGGVAAYGISEWRSVDADRPGGARSDPVGEERARAEVYAEEVVAACDEDSNCRVLGLERVAPGLWRVRTEVRGRDVCANLDLERFREDPDDDGEFEGFTVVACEDDDG